MTNAVGGNKLSAGGTGLHILLVITTFVSVLACYQKWKLRSLFCVATTSLLLLLVPKPDKSAAVLITTCTFSVRKPHG